MRRLGDWQIRGRNLGVNGMVTVIHEEGLKTGGSVYTLMLEKGLMSKDRLGDLLQPENRTDQREIPQ